MTDRQGVFIVSGVRTPIGSFRGSLSSLSSVELGSIAAKEALLRGSGIEIDEVVAGSVLTAGVGQNVARQIALAVGLPSSTPACTVNKVCSSSMKALQLATQSIRAGTTSSALVVGAESMSRVPFYVNRGEIPFGGTQLVDGVQKDGLEDAYLHTPMGVCAEKSAKDFNITRAASDEYAIESYRKAASAWKSGQFKLEVIPVTIKGPKGDTVVSEDDEYKKLVAEKVPSLRPVFVKDGTGTITPANASSLNDGGVAAVIACGGSVPDGHQPIAEIVDFAEAGGDPVDFTVIPIQAVQKLLAARGMSVSDISLWEVNEAFSVTVLAFIQALDLDPARVNVKGGAVALGHPLGMSGLRVTLSLAYSLHPGHFGIAAICNGGGEAMAVLIKRVHDW